MATKYKNMTITHLLNTMCDIPHSSYTEKYSYTFFDVTTTATRLGWAIRTWSDPSIIQMLVDAGANTFTPIIINYKSYSLKDFVKGWIDCSPEFELDMWERAPSAEWANRVLEILN